MRSTKLSLFLLGLVLTSVASSFVEAADPRQPGPYAVGVRTHIFVDEDRTCAITGKSRTLVTEIWYPVSKDEKPTETNRFSDFWIRPAGIKAGTMAVSLFGGEFAKIDQSFKNVAMRDAAIDDGPFPLLIFSHGNGGLRHQNTYQAEYLASHGYVVAAADHTGNAVVTILPEEVVPFSAETSQPERLDDRALDVSYLLTQITKLSADKSSWLFGQIDTDLVGAFGHSFGGFTVCRAMELDSRIKAIMPMTYAGARREASEESPCEIPMLVILGDADRTVNEEGNQKSTAYFEIATGPKYLLNFKDAGHFTFTEMTQINPDWGDGIGTEENKEGEVTFTFSDALEDQRITNEYTVAFFDCFLRGDPDAKAFLNQDHYPEELEYRVK